MPGDNGYYAPVQYTLLWPVLGLVLIALVIGWYVWMLAHVRRRARGSAPRPAPQPSPTVLRDRYLALIGEIERDHGDGALSTRRAHQRLGAILRMYAHESSGVRAQVMTLADLDRAGLAPLSRAVSAYYPVEFREAETGSVAEAATLARQVVTTWS